MIIVLLNIEAYLSSLEPIESRFRLSLLKRDAKNDDEAYVISVVDFEGGHVDRRLSEFWRPSAGFCPLRVRNKWNEVVMSVKVNAKLRFC